MAIGFTALFILFVQNQLVIAILTRQRPLQHLVRYPVSPSPAVGESTSSSLSGLYFVLTALF